VRVGVAVEDVLREGRAAGGGGSGGSSGGGGDGGEWPTSRRPLPSPLHPRSPFGSIRKPAELEEAARKMPQFARPARDQFFVPNADQDYAISTSHPVAFRQAVKDLPAAAITAVREMLLDKQSLTVSRVHQRRPPYLDVGPRVVGWAAVQRELQPSEFKGTLRRQPEDTMAAVRRKPFSLGATAPWNKSKHTLSGMDTFDFMAKQSAVRYYVTDFTEPTGPPMRPASRGPTRFASNVPSMLERDAEVLKARETNKLLCVFTLPALFFAFLSASLSSLSLPRPSLSLSPSHTHLSTHAHPPPFPLRAAAPASPSPMTRRTTRTTLRTSRSAT
jgi:hypothetical protein